MEYLIGEFSMIVRLSVKTLRFYHEEGILIPSRIDALTGYRWYDEAATERALAIVRLRDLGFSLPAVKQMLASCREDEDIVPFLERRRGELAREIEEFRAMEGRIGEFLERQKEMKAMNVNREIIVRELPELPIASIRYAGRYAEAGIYIGKLMRLAGRFAVGGPFMLYHDHEYREEGADLEVCVPVRGAPAEGPAVSRILPGCRAVTLVHQGPYESLHEGYVRIADYMKERGWKSATPSREVYLRGPGMFFRGNPKKYLTEIQVPVAEA